MGNRIIIDVREPFEYKIGHVKGALNLPPAALMAGAKLLADVPKDTEIILYCRSGARSNASMYYLRQMGFTNLVNGINQAHVEKNYL
jgi:phage shock protein E